MSSPSRRGIGQRLREGEQSFSFEFFPPKDEAGEAQLWDAIRELEPYQPTFVSVTYGAGGTSRDTTVRITGRIARETPMLPLGHLTCVGHTRDELQAILASYAEAGVHNVLALRGDPQDGPRAEWTPTPGGLTYASDLVELAAPDFTVGVAAFPDGHPSAPSLERDAEVLLAKERAGAEFAITDMVFRATDYFALLERAKAVGVTMPILPGIMPILNLGQVRRMAELSGRDLPAEVVQRITAHADDPVGLRAEGIAVAAEMCEALLAGGAPGLHFYTLNRSRATRDIFTALRITV
ncbi:methylenetetrahydrofolate reductase [NAD(P)H] [Nocardioides sp.]|uniref:methylenetetrahydrofolate reductase [NAD(P)H] n=1 Tax=Nocardioides sp. TaxID=35761 RepID=UPI003D149A52